MKVLHFGGEQIMDSYVAELDEANRIAAVWVKKKEARGPSVFDPRKHVFELHTTDEFVGAARHEIVSWIKARQRRS